jgi:hypothetical protein
MTHGLSGDTPFGAMLARYQAAARREGLSWELTSDEFRQLAQRDCHFCNTAPGVLSDSDFNEVGRVGNASGFTADNSIPCCQICARGLAASSYAEHLEWLHRVAAHHALRDVVTPADMFGLEP